ncbi:MAG: HNH endonuclease [Microbacteriaceae bacterium]
MRTLVLNAGYEPLAVVDFRRAMILIMNGKASLLSSDAEHPVFTVTGPYERPSVILLTHYVKLPHNNRVPVTRRGVLRRDLNRCGYCGTHASTIDHIQPKSRGGGDSWDNLVACCLKCNNDKGNRTLGEMGWKLRVIPQVPHGVIWMVRGIERPAPQWSEFLQLAA